MHLIFVAAILTTLLPVFLAQVFAPLNLNNQPLNDQMNTVNAFGYPNSHHGNNNHNNQNKKPKKCDTLLPPVGMILGTSSGRVAIVRDYIVQVLLNDEGCASTSCYLAVTGKTCNEIVVGARAELLAALNPSCAISDVKSLIGLTYEEIRDYINEYNLPYSVVCHQDSRPQLLVSSQGITRSFYIEDIVAQIYAYLKVVAEKKLCGRIRDVVITVPSTFTMAQRQTLKAACASAGIEVLEIVSEISAAARAAAILNGMNTRHVNAVIVKVGGGFAEVAVFSCKHGNIEIKAQGGAKVGGNKIDLTLIKYFVEDFIAQHGIDPSGDALAMNRLKIAAELAKLTFETKNEASIDIDNFFKGITFSSVITRSVFESLNSDFFDSLMSLVQTVVTQSNVDKETIHDVILFGGSSGIIKIRELLKHFFRCNEVIIYLDAAIEGVALIADSYRGLSRKLDSKNTKESKLNDAVFCDVTQQRFGVETADGVMNFVIEPNTPLPVNCTQTYTTSFDNQTEVLIKIYEGKNEMTSDNEFLSELHLRNLKPAPKGELKIDVTFDVDVKNVLSVTAIEQGTKNIIEKTIYEPEKRKSNVGLITNNADTEEMAIVKFESN